MGGLKGDAFFNFHHHSCIQNSGGCEQEQAGDSQGDNPKWKPDNVTEQESDQSTKGKFAGYI